MGLISRYTLRQIGAPMFLASLVVAFFIVGTTVRTQMSAILELIPAEQIRLLDISRISVYAVPALVGYILPITFLLGIMMAFSRMAQHSELVAMKAAGIPLKRVVAPVVLGGVLLSGAAYVAQDQGQAWAYRRMAALISLEMPLRVSIDLLPTGVMHEFGDWKVYIGKRDADGALRDIVVLQPGASGEANAFYADSARLVHEGDTAVLEMHKGYLVPADPTRHITFDVLRQPVPKLKPVEAPDRTEGMLMAQLLAEEKRLTQRFAETGALPVAADLRDVRVEIKDRLCFPLMCLAMSLVGAPIGARTQRSGRSYAYAMGLSLIIVYFVLRRLVSPPLLMSLPVTVLLGQTPNMLLALLGIWLIGRVDRL